MKSAQGQESRKILIVEDDLALGKLLQEILERAGFTVLLTEDCMQGLHKALEFRPHAMILDFNLPAGDGATLLRRLRKQDALRDVPVLLYSAMPEAYLRNQVPEQPNVSFLSKSTPFSGVIARLAQILCASAVR